MNLTIEKAEEMLKSTVRMSMGWQLVDDFLPVGKLPIEELKKQFIKDIFNKFSLEVVYKLARTTERDDLSDKNQEVNLDMGEFYHNLKKAKSIKVYNYSKIEKINNIPNGNALCVLYELIEPIKFSNTITNWMNESYSEKFKDVNWSLKKSNEDNQTIIIFE